MIGSRLLDKIAAVLRRDLLTAIRYRSGFVLTLAGAGVELLAFYYLSVAIGPGFHPGGMRYFPFVVVGTGLYTLFIMGIQAFVNVIQQAQQTGTLEVLMTTATPGPVLVLLSAFSAFGRNTVQFVLYVAAGLLIVGLPGRANLVGAALVLALSITIAAALGMFAAALQLATQKGGAMLWLLGSLTWLVTGTMFPITTLPKPLQILAELLPISHALNAMRLALLQGTGFALLGKEVLILGLFVTVLTPLSVLLFSYVLRQSRLAGALSFY